AIGPGDALERNANLPLLQLRGVGLQPSRVDGEDVVRHPEHVGLVAAQQPFDFIGNTRGRTPAMGEAVHRMTAPLAAIRAPARRDDRKGPAAMMLTPSLDVAIEI